MTKNYLKISDYERKNFKDLFDEQKFVRVEVDDDYNAYFYPMQRTIGLVGSRYEFYVDTLDYEGYTADDMLEDIMIDYDPWDYE